jgi:hypothetical protein
MSTLAPPLALGTVGIILLVVLVFVLAALAYSLLIRDNPRQSKVDAEREEVAEEIGLRERPDFESDLRPPRDEP